MEKFIYWEGTFVSDNIINLSDYKNSQTIYDNEEAYKEKFKLD